MKRIFKVCAVSLLCSSILPTLTFASSFQRFTGFAWDNPARLALVKDKQIIIEGMYSTLKTRFSGSSRGGTGTANGVGNVWPFYLRYAQRLGEPLVVGLDITTPFMAKTAYPQDSIVRFASTYTYVKAITYSPNIAYSPVKWLSLGLGLDYVDLLFDIQSMVGVQPLTSNSSGRKWGWHAGIAAVLNPATMTSVGFTYYSPISNFPLSGKSTLGNNVVVTRWKVTGANLPATYILTGSHKITPNWTLIGIVSYTIWSINTLHYINTAVGNINPVFNFTNTWRLAALNNYVFNPTWSGKFGLSYDQGPTNNVNRGIGVPTDNALAVLLGGGYQIKPNLGLELAYAHVFFVKTRLQNVPSRTFGFLSSQADSFDAKLTWNF